MEIDEMIAAEGGFRYCHESLKSVNALARGMAKSDYRSHEASIIDIENNLVHFFPEPDSLNSLVDKFFNKHQKQNGLESIADAHCAFIALHPFLNGNGRTARFIADINLAALGYTPFLNTSINRSRYYSAMREYIKTGDIKLMATFISDYAFKELV